MKQTKNICIFFTFLFSIIILSVAGNDVLITKGKTPDKEYEFSCEENVLLKTPVWNNNQTEPPISLKNAIVISTNFLKKLVKNTNEWSMTEISIRSYSSNIWYYSIFFEMNKDENGKPFFMTGIPFKINIIVLMDGTTLPIKKEKIFQRIDDNDIDK